MGGLAIDVRDIDDGLHSVTLTPAGLILLAERGRFIEVSDDDIRDKSKADIFAKCLVVLQVAWIALQTISRKATGNPLSPLEIHTIVHAACASVMYILWFRKPLDVQAPTIVSKAGFEDLIALMLMQTRRFGTTWYSHLDPPAEFAPVTKGRRSEASFLMFDGLAPSRREKGCWSCGGGPTLSTVSEVEVADKGVPHVVPRTCDSCANLLKSERRRARISEARTLFSPITSHPPAGIRCGPPPGVKAVCDLRSGEFIPEGIGLQPLITGLSHHDIYVTKEGWFNSLWRFLERYPPSPVLPAQISPTLKKRLPKIHSKNEYPPAYRHEINLSLSEKDHKRWKLAGAAFLKEMEIQGVSDPGHGRYRNFEITELPSFRDSEAKTINGWPRFNPLLTWRCPNVNGELPNKLQGRFLSTLWLLASLYGGIHLALWNYDFPTPVESILWRISAATLTSAPVLFLFLLIWYLLADWLGKIFPSSAIWNSFAWCLAIIVFLIPRFAAMLFYVFARIFIVVESFMSLRNVPIGVYEGGLGWSKYIPHL